LASSRSDACAVGTPSGSFGGTSISPSATAAGSRNASRHEISAASPPSSGANEMPAACTPANVPIDRPSRSRGTTSASAAITSGVVNAFATPCAARPTRNTPMFGASAAITDATA